MGWRRALAVAALVVMTATACGREGPIASTPTNAPASRLTPIALPAIPERDDTPVVWTQRSDKVGVRVEMTPGRPIVGDVVRFDIKMTYGDPPYRPGGFNYSLLLSEVGGETSTASCGIGSVPAGFRPKPPKPFDDNLRRKYRYFEPGPHTFSFGAHPSCSGAGGVSIERTFTVRGTRPANGWHRTGSDGQRQVDLLVSPDVTKAYAPAHLYAIFEDRTGEPFSWRVSFGDGRRPVVGGPACKRGTASSDGRYERRFVHTWNDPAEYHLTVEVSPRCLADANVRGARVIDERLFVRPRGIRSRGAVELPSHLYPPLHAERLGPVKLVVGDDDCVSLLRPDGERIQVVWPAGSWLLRKPRGVTTGFVLWMAGKTRKDVRVLGSGPVDAIPKRCRFADTALLLAPLPD